MYYGGYGMYNGFYSFSYLLVIIGAVLCLLASARVKSTYKKYAKVRSASGMTGEIVVTRQDSFSLQSSIISFVGIAPCSIVSTPALSAATTPSVLST